MPKPNRIAFTQLAIDKLKPPATGRVMYWDRHCPGFGLRIAAPRPDSRDGRKTWIAMYRVGGKAVFETIGTLAQVPKVDKARDLARASILKAKGGDHPIEERRAEKARRQEQARAAEATAREAVESRFAAVAQRFIADRSEEAGWAPKYLKEVRRILDHDVLPRWCDKPIREITTDDVEKLINEKKTNRERRRKGTKGGASTQANRTLTRLHTLFAWALRKKLINADPTIGISPVIKEKARDRVLGEDEIVWFWRGAEQAGQPYGAIFKLLLITAQRESEVAGMRWSELNLETREWKIPRERTKSDRAHTVHLSDLAIEIIQALPRQGDLLFPSRVGKPISSFDRPKNRVDAAMSQLREGAGNWETEIAPWILHDLRRTATTIMAELNVLPHVADRILNHSGGTIRGVAAVYNRHEYLNERKAALDALGRYVEKLIDPSAASNVVELQQRAATA
jgi:integrase